MYISRLVIRNFRNFELLDTKISDGVTCIVGDNNSGKSNLLHAIRLVADINLSNHHRQLLEHDFHCGINLANPTHILVALEFTDFVENEYEDALAANCLVEDDVTARLTYRFRPNSLIREEIAIGDHTGKDLTLEDYEWEWTGGGGVDPAFATWSDDVGSTFKWSSLQSYQVSILNPLRDVISELKQHRTSPLLRLLRVMEPTETNKKEIIENLKEANKKISEHTLLKELAEIIEKTYNKTAGEAHLLEIEVGLAVPSFSSIEKALTLLLSTEFVDKFDPSRNGLGLNNILFIAMVLEYFDRRQAMRSSAGQLLLIEEPEAHLHPQLQRVLYESISSRNVQTLITTHSTHLTSHAHLNSFLVLTKTGEAAISCASIAKNADLSSKDVADLERFLDATRSTLLYARRVILVEGPAELYLVPLFAKHVMGLDLDRLGIAVVAIHGTHFEAYSKLLGPNGLNVSCAIITDGDPDDDYNLRETDHLERGFIRVFQCDTTFEKELVITGLLTALAQTATDCSRPKLSKQLREAEHFEGNSFNDLKESILSLATRVGKARFAQILSRHAGHFEDAPSYIKNAINWVAN